MAKSTKIKISLTDFIDFINKTGGTKMTKVRQVKSRDDYSPGKDFYKILREGIVNNHTKDGSKNDLNKILGDLTDKKKATNYPDAIKGYQKFWGRKDIQWLDPPFKHWKVGELDIKVNPELGLEYLGKTYVVKLYFKADKLTKDRVCQILSLMEDQLRDEVEDDVIFAILDVRNAKLHENVIGDITYLPLLEGEARSFETIWKGI
jgi:hypothetical protein